MQVSAGFANFYNTRPGRIIRQVLAARVGAHIPKNGDLRWAAIGYAQPYLDLLISRGIASPLGLGLPYWLGGHAWPNKGPGKAFLMDDEELPFASNSVDTLLLMHALEFARSPERLLEECARVLVGQGRLLLVAPNRRSYWTAAEWTPFGSGHPFTSNQLQSLLAAQSLVVEQHSTALFVPAFRWRPLWKTALAWERMGPLIAPALGGVHIIEASKQQFSGIAVPVSPYRAPRRVAPATSPS
jgi:SAM-dependent methyltransferase